MKKKDLMFNELKIFFSGINWNNVYKKKSGFIIIEKETNNNIISIPTDNKLIRGINFKVIEKLLDKEIYYTPFNGIISLKEMKKDQKRKMKNYVKKFYYIKPDRKEFIEDFQVFFKGKKINEKKEKK